VSRRGFLLFANAKVDGASLDARLDFDLSLVEVLGDTSWVEPTLVKIKATLMSDVPPPAAPDCEACGFVAAVNEAAVNEAVGRDAP
jgi:hypothetical protein